MSASKIENREPVVALEDEMEWVGPPNPEDGCGSDIAEGFRQIVSACRCNPELFINILSYGTIYQHSVEKTHYSSDASYINEVAEDLIEDIGRNHLHIVGGDETIWISGNRDVTILPDTSELEEGELRPWLLDSYLLQGSRITNIIANPEEEDLPEEEREPIYDVYRLEGSRVALIEGNDDLKLEGNRLVEIINLAEGGVEKFKDSYVIDGKREAELRGDDYLFIQGNRHVEFVNPDTASTNQLIDVYEIDGNRITSVRGIDKTTVFSDRTVAIRGEDKQSHFGDRTVRIGRSSLDDPFPLDRYLLDGDYSGLASGKYTLEAKEIELKGETVSIENLVLSGGGAPIDFAAIQEALVKLDQLSEGLNDSVSAAIETQLSELVNSTVSDQIAELTEEKINAALETLVDAKVNGELNELLDAKIESTIETMVEDEVERVLSKAIDEKVDEIIDSLTTESIGIGTILPDGGIVFGYEAGDWLVVAPARLHAIKRWGVVGTDTILPSYKTSKEALAETNSSYYNTDVLVNYYSGAQAALYCRSIGYDLPSTRDVQLIYNSRNTINALDATGNLPTEPIWTSTEQTESTAWNLSPRDDTWRFTYGQKGFNYWVVPFRRIAAYTWRFTKR